MNAEPPAVARGAGTRKLLAAMLAGAALVACAPSFAACPAHPVVAPDSLRLSGESLLIVTHPTSTHDARYSSKRGVDDAVEFAKAQSMPVVYLQDDTADTRYFPDDCEPTAWVRSQDGEIRFKLPASRVYLAGGHLELCLAIPEDPGRRHRGSRFGRVRSGYAARGSRCSRSSLPDASWHDS